jgi:glycosyltransferase involved in cell wall biosynthesis
VVEPDLRRVSEKPAVSVLLPVHDADATLGACLRSLQRQSEARWECVLVDDGSQDTSADLAAAFAARDPRIRVLRQAHRGLVAALRLGLDACRAPFIARMDADDWMHRDRLALQLSMLSQEREIAAIGCGVRLFPRVAQEEGIERRVRDDGTLVRSGRRGYEAWLAGIHSPEDVAREAFVECPIPHPTLFARREVLCRYGYRDVAWPEDYDLVLRMLEAGERLANHPRRLLGWRDSPDRLSRRSERYAIDRFIACKAAFLASGLLAETSRYILWGYGETGRALRKALLVHDKTPSLIVELHPRRIGQWIHGAEVIKPEDLAELDERPPLLASVAGEGPRNQIRAALGKMGMREGREFVCVA